MDVGIIQIVFDVFDQYGDIIRFDIERFEEALNDEAPNLMNECYLVVLGVKTGLFDAMIFDKEIDLKGYVDYVMDVLSLGEDEALFMVSILKTIVHEMGYYFAIPDMDQLLNQAYQRQDFHQLDVIAKTYFQGFGVQQDYEKSFEIYNFLYSQGDDRGAYYLGYMYEHGYGVEKNIEKAFMYYRSREDDLCYYQLGRFYMLGRYVSCDYEKAYEYLKSSHYAEAYFYRGLLLEQQRDYAGAFESYFEGAQLFQAECIYQLAMYLKRGLGVDRDMQEAYHYFKYAYYLLHGESAYQLALINFDGLVCKKDEQLALHYLHQATLLYSQEACLTLARFYEFGYYVEKNIQKSIMYYQKANDIHEYTRKRMKEDMEECE